jgi:hypothetical protein
MCVEDYIDTKWFDHLLDGVKPVCQIDQETRTKCKEPVIGFETWPKPKALWPADESIGIEGKIDPKVERSQEFVTCKASLFNDCC